MNKYAIFWIFIHLHIYALFWIFMHMGKYAEICIFIQVDNFGAAAPVQSQQSIAQKVQIKLYTIRYDLLSLFWRGGASAKSTIYTPQRGN